MALRRLRLNEAVWVSGGLVIVLMTVFQVYGIFRRIEIVEDSARRELVSTTRLLAEHTSASLRAVDAAMHDAQRATARHEQPDPPSASAVVREQISTLPQLFDIAIVPAGDPAARSLLTPAPMKSTRPAAPSSQLRLSAAYFIPERNAWSVALLRDIQTGPSQAVVVASLDLDYFKSVYDRLQAPAGSHTELLSRDGRMLTGHPQAPAAEARAAIEDTYRALLSAGDQSVHLLQGHGEDSAQFYVAQAVAGFPLAVGMRVERSVLLSPWYVQAGHSTARTALLCISVAVLMWLVLRQLRRREQAEARLREAEKLEALGNMASGIAHDFNSVLSAIGGHGNLAKASVADTGATQRHLTRILAAVERGRGLVEQILTYSRSARGTRVPVDVAAVAHDTLDLVRASLPAHIELRFRRLARATTVLADPTHIHQLVMNLCDNASQAMDRAGVLAVDVDAVTVSMPTKLSHGALLPGRYVVLRVCDQGHGIDEELLDRLFEPFVTTRRTRGGTGLGLAVVHAIVSELGGAIDVSGAQPIGSTFALHLPATTAPAPTSAALDEELPRGSGQRILVVEDEEELMLLHEEMLAALNYEPVGFTRPGDALSEFLADPSRVDALVLDLLMPEMTGLELTSRARRVRPELPVILVTGQPAAALEHETSAAGIDAILQKPLDFQALARALAAALRTLDASTPPPR